MQSNGETFPVVYCMKSESQPGLVKIGYTIDIQQRLKQLNASTGLAYPFEVCFVYEVSKDSADKFLHNVIDLLNHKLRTISKRGRNVRVREFFNMSDDDAYYLFEQIALLTDTEDRLHRTSPNGGYLDTREDMFESFVDDDF